MPDVYRVRYTLAAADQLNQIFEYILEDSPQSARNMIARLLKAMDGLEILPHRYPVLERSSELLGDEVRSMPVPPFVVRYHVDDVRRTVTILGVRHGARRR